MPELEKNTPTGASSEVLPEAETHMDVSPVTEESGAVEPETQVEAPTKSIPQMEYFIEEPVEPELTTATPEEMADAIAQAVESSLQQEARIAAVAGEPLPDVDQEVILNQPVTDAPEDIQAEASVPQPEEMSAEVIPEELEEPPKPGKRNKRKEKKQKKQKAKKGQRSPTDTGRNKKNVPERENTEAPFEETEPEAPNHAADSDASEQNAVNQSPKKPEARKGTAPKGKPAPAVKKDSKPKTTTEEPVRKPGTGHAPIPQSNVPSISIAESLGMMFSDLYKRQQAALPSATASLRTTEKRMGTMVRLGRMMGPIRGVLVLLMVFALGGRSFPWMLLGFLGGNTGITVALMVTILAMAASWQSVYRGIRDIIYLRTSYETMLLLVTLLTMAEAVLKKNTATLLPLTAMAWCASGQAAFLSGQANLRSLRAVITARGRVGIRMVRNLWEHTDCIGKSAAGTAGFVRRQQEPDVWHKGYTVFFLPFLFLALVLTAYLAARTEESFLSILVMLLNVGLPVSLVLCCARPYVLLAETLTGRGVVAGWFGMRELFGKKNVLIYDEDLFPKEVVGHKGVRLYGNEDLRTVVSFAGSLMLRANVGLTDVFARLMREVSGSVCEVQHFQTMEGGVRGDIYGYHVLVGSYQFMQLMGISIPKKSPKTGIYVSLNGTMSAVIAMRYALHRGAVSGMRRLVREPRLTPLLVTRNFHVNPAYVEKWFKAPVSQLACPRHEIRRKLSEPLIFKGGITCGFVLREGVAAYSRVVTGARRVYRLGFWATIGSILLSLVLTIRTAMAIAAGTALISGQRLLLLQIILIAVVEIAARLSVRK